MQKQYHYLIIFDMGPFNYYVTLFLANFDPPVTKCHTGPTPLPPRNVTLVCRPDKSKIC